MVSQRHSRRSTPISRGKLQKYLALRRDVLPVLLMACISQAFLVAPSFQIARTKLAAHQPVEFGGLQHAGVLVRDTEASTKWYTEVLGFEDETHLRPNLPFKGAFCRAGAQQVHLMELPNPDPLDGRPEHGGRDRHLAFTVRSIEPLKERLDAAGVGYTMSKSGRAALFCRDLDSNALEFLEADV
eukprot:2048-Heterococcus_DN1.PRE.2